MTDLQTHTFNNLNTSSRSYGGKQTNSSRELLLLQPLELYCM